MSIRTDKERQYDREYKKRQREAMTEDQRRAISLRYREYRLAWYQRNKKRTYDKVMEYREKHPEKVREWAKAHRERDPQRFMARMRKHQDRRLTRFRELKATLKCSRCPETHPACMDFHHTDPAKKDFSIGRFGRYRTQEKLMEEIKKCVVLCANCHRAEHTRQRKERIDSQQDSSVKRYQERQKQWFLNLKKQYSCAECGETRSECIDFHHQNARNKMVTIGQRYHCQSQKKTLRELKKCIALCSNCHRKHHYELRNARTRV